jgi:hypothetical protein
MSEREDAAEPYSIVRNIRRQSGTPRSWRRPRRPHRPSSSISLNSQSPPAVGSRIIDVPAPAGRAVDRALARGSHWIKRRNVRLAPQYLTQRAQEPTWRQYGTGPGGSRRRSKPLHVIFFGHLSNTAAGALICRPQCPSGGDEISHGWRAIIASMCQTDQGAWRVFINRAVHNGLGRG